MGVGKELASGGCKPVFTIALGDSVAPEWALVNVCCGAPGQIRTAGTRFRRAVLYPLSYGGGVVFFSHDHPV